MRKERLARGWTIAELSKQTKVAAPHLSRVEAGTRPPTERIARALDEAFKTTWFMDWYTESRTWMPPGFRDWPEIENKASDYCSGHRASSTDWRRRPATHVNC